MGEPAPAAGTARVLQPSYNRLSGEEIARHMPISVGCVVLRSLSGYDLVILLICRRHNPHGTILSYGWLLTPVTPRFAA